MAEEINKKSTNSLTTELTSLDLTKMTPIQLEKVSEDLAKSKMIPHDNPQDIIASIMLSHEIGINPLSGLMMGKKLNKNSIFAVMKGKALGLDPVTSIEQLHYISDTSSSTGIHIMTSLAIKANVHYEILEDYKPVYGYLTADKNVIRKEDFDDELHQIYIDPKDADQKKLRVKVSGKVIDYKTTIRFKRTLGDGQILDTTLTYYYSEFKNLHEKDNWKNNKKTMLRNRVMAIGFRIVADDVLNGLYETSEITDSHNIKYEIKETPIMSVQTNNDVEEVVIEDAVIIEDHNNKNSDELDKEQK